MSKILDVNGDMIQTHHYDRATDTSSVCTTQDVNPYLDQNRAELNADSGSWKGDLHKIASVPMSVVELWAVELGSNPLSAENRAWFQAKVRSSEYSKLRTKGGKI